MSGYIKIPRESESKEFTLVAWIKKSFTGEDEVPILQKSTGGNRGYELLVDSYYGTDRLALFVYSDVDGTQRFRTSEQIPSDELTFVAATFDNETGEASLYINEMEQELTSDASPATYDLDENSLLIGATSELSSATHFNGSIDDVRVYNRKLSGTEIQQLYENRNTDEITNGLFICWPMLFNMASSYSLGFNDLQIESNIGESVSKGLNINVNHGHMFRSEIGQSIDQGLQTNIRYGIALTASIAASDSAGLTPTYHQRVFAYTLIGQSQSSGFDHEVIDHYTVNIQTDLGKSISRFYSPSLRIGEGVILTVDEVQKNFSEGLLFNLLAGSSAILQTDIAESISAGLDINIVNNVLDNVNYGDDVYLLVNDANGKTKVYKGVVKDRSPQNRILSVTASLGDSILPERIIKEDYPEQDIGLTAKQIIDTYCAPLTSTNINTNTGITAPIKADGKKPLTIFEKLRREYGIYYYVSFDWDVNLYLEDAIELSNFADDSNRGYKIRLGDE